MTRSLLSGSLGVAWCLACLPAPAAAEVTPAPIFGDHMVLQAGVKAPVFGATEPGGTVQIGIALPVQLPDGQTAAEAVADVTVTADDAGRWIAEVGPLKPGLTLELTISDADEPAGAADRKTFTDVLTGDVWLCSGQSNMGWQLRNTLDADREIKTAKDDEVRLFTVPRHSAPEPQTELKEGESAQWVKLTPEAAAGFSAVGYYFGKTIHNRTGQPVGLINSSWGGTPVEAWTRLETLESLETSPPLLEWWDRMDERFYAAEKAGKEWTDRHTPTNPHHPANLNNGMIAPLAPFALKGAIWYQGESNASRAEQYGELFPAMIKDWREQFDQDVPFYWVQLANYLDYRDTPNASAIWAELREAQDNTLDELQNVGQAVIIDVGEAKDIHPRNKVDVGERLALAALEYTYGMDKTGQLAPRKSKVTIDGSTATVTFDTDDDVLQIRRDESVGADAAEPDDALGFAVAGPDKRFYWAKAKLTGPNTVTVTAPEEVPEIASVRYAWADNPRVTLFNTRGIPAAPFRTDDWPRQTAGKYGK